MSSLVYIYFIFLLTYFVVHVNAIIMLCTFLVNFVPALVLFELVASRPFVSTSFCRGFSVACEALDQPL